MAGTGTGPARHCDLGLGGQAGHPGSNLSCLWLMENCIGAAVARALAGAAHLDSLTELDLALNPIGPEGALALVSSPFLSRLTSLRVDVTADPFLSGGFGVKASKPELEEARAALRLRFGAAWREEPLI